MLPPNHRPSSVVAEGRSSRNRDSKFHQHESFTSNPYVVHRREGKGEKELPEARG